MALACLVVPRPATADEFTLKDGRKMTGTIVGYEGDMFRVQTDYGFVLIRKDKVVSIRVEPGTNSKPNEAAAGGKPANEPASASPASNSREVAKPATPPPPSRPINAPLPVPIREHVEGNEYVNDSLLFSMYKPPDWRLMEDVHKEKVPAIVAMSSPDEQTLLFVDRQVWSAEPVLNDDHVEANLRSAYQEFKKLSESSLQVDGQPAMRRSFTGVIDGAEWHGVSVHVAHGNAVFGIIELTASETYEFQEAIFNKIVKSFHFLPPPPAGSGRAASVGAKPAVHGPA
ncbi:MAG TPA: hypothetical protein VFM21_12225 [Terriglobia bacterium]|nr:hypothetical protein [Terriglobia bacterium]